MEQKVGFFKSIRFKLIVIYVLLIVIAMMIVSVYFLRELENRLVGNYTTVLKDRAKMAQMTAAEYLLDSDNAELEIMLKNIFPAESDAPVRAQVISKDNTILASSFDDDAKFIGQKTNKPIIKRALDARPFPEFSLRLKPKDKRRYLVQAMDVRAGKGEVIGAVYIEAPVEHVYEQVQDINRIFVSGTVIALIITSALIVLLARTITLPIMDIRKQALRMGRGDFSRQVRVYSTDEIGELAASFNELTSKLHVTTLMRDREQKRLRSVLSHMTDGVIATDQSGSIILLNRRAEELLGVSLKHVLRKPIMSVLRLENTHRLVDLYHRDKPILLDFSTDEESFMIEANFSTIQEEEGPINGFIAVLHDVTEKEKIERERREFVANVSHELRTPLTTLKSYLEALADGALSDEEIAPRFLEVTQNETERMIRLVNDLLQLSKIDAKDYRLTLSSVELGAFLHGVIDRFDMIVKDENITFVRRIARQPLYVRMDADKVTQVLDNVISNAMKYSPKGGNVVVTLLQRGKQAQISISDQGLGIPKEAQEKVFDRFYRVDKARARNVGGTGLGLAIAQEYIQAHDGEIWISSEYQKGTTVYITLPYTFKGGRG
ncbi:cell wall metabolism sensor histidine kinase WalK [Shouchella lonarensis]|uniref:histidine kinase n=1 Tax=Shouchella lonarensis TaxID=1464122 RepID=A0A1G6LW36_9BACI|nr:cell wall metabolism sensor histidine kinase WalK [Shouchella lonarensis]SDC47419.1 PAS/PAC sensor signal transduction histidine kinase [Shouchella lonarensis]